MLWFFAPFAKRFDSTVCSYCIMNVQSCQSEVALVLPATGFASAGDLETALMLLGQMRCLQIQPDSILFNTILTPCCSEEEWLPCRACFNA